jgi:hypothetical protein
MKPLAKKIWEEPAAFIGLLTSLALLVLNLLTDADWGVESIVTIVAPLASALGIRQLVYSPAAMEKATAPPDPRTRLAKAEERL